MAMQIYKIQVPAIVRLLEYKKLDDGSFEVCLPRGMSVVEAVKALNKSSDNKLFNLASAGQLSWWEENEANYLYSTEHDKTYRIKVDKFTFNESRNVQEDKLQTLAPIGALSLAEACERVLTKNNSTLLRVRDSAVWVRCLSPGVVLDCNENGLYIRGGIADSKGGTGIAAAYLI